MVEPAVVVRYVAHSRLVAQQRARNPHSLYAVAWQQSALLAEDENGFPGETYLQFAHLLVESSCPQRGRTSYLAERLRLCHHTPIKPAPNSAIVGGSGTAYG